MNEKDLISERQKYLDEMMRLYSTNKNSSDTADENLPSKENMQPPEEDNTPETETENISDEQQFIPSLESNEEEAPQPKMQTVDKRFPPPVIPDFIRNPEPPPPPPQPVPPPQTPPTPPPPVNTPNIPPPVSQRPQMPEIPPRPVQNQFGFLKVEVRTGDNGLPVPNAAVTISRQQENGEELIFTGKTDMSGSTERIKLPAPANMKNNNPDSFGNYSRYTVTVFAKDFYRETSREVPVFAGITSIQRFNLIPQPFNYDDNGQSIVFSNTEPEF